jgi:hypothetical protein
MAEYSSSAIGKQKRLYRPLQLIAALVVLLMPLFSQAIEDGISCSSCHTMHNSQDGVAMGVSDAQSYLLVNTCTGCHQGNSGALLSDNFAPIVWHDTEPNTNNTASSANNTLAGGSFYWVADTGGDSDNMGHNVADISGIDGTLSTNPPGGAAISTQLSCEGTVGCHTATGSHHNNVGGNTAAPTTTVWVDGSSQEASYRFLNGIDGGENGDWEYTNSSTDHNVYYASSTWNNGSTNTITSLCTQCHGNYHGNDAGTGPTDPWLRHPTDISLNAQGGEYANYITYDPIVPVAVDSDTTTAIGGANSQFETIESGKDDVTCISCHRAHGSGFDDLLRWNYRAWPGSGSSTGCPTCHTSKN